MGDEKNPLKDWSQSKEAAKDERKKKELELWHHWKTNGQKREHLEPLLKLYEGNIAQKARLWKAPAIPESAFKLVLQEHLINAFKTYSPDRGTAINTWAENGMQKAKRYNARGQNLAYIPEGQIEGITPINRANDHLTEELGRAPTNQEIADHLTETWKPITAKRVETIRRSQRKDIPGSSFEHDPVPRPSSYEEQQIEVAANILPKLFPNHPEMHALFNHIYGTNDHERISSTTALAKKLGKSMSQVSRMRTQLGNTLKEHMGLSGEEKD
jgi:hypothetical protein